MEVAKIDKIADAAEWVIFNYEASNFPIFKECIY
jgi:hypothetical protein